MKKLVVIGGGFAGANICKKLENYFDVTLIDEKNYFEFTPGILRSIIYLNHLKKIQVNHKDYLKKSRILIEKALRLVDGKVLINSKKEIKYEYLVICSGSTYRSPIKDRNTIMNSRGENLKKYNYKLSKSRNIIIAGGGLVSVELAGEILCKYKNKNITIIHSKERIIQRNNKKSILYIENFLKKNNVKIIYNETVIRKEKNKIITNKNNKFNYNIMFFCTGITPNSDFVDKKNLDYKGYIKVDKFLRMFNKKNIFVCGDVASINEEKTAQAAEEQSKIVIKNLIALEKNRRLKEYISKTRPFSISLGLWNGIFEYKNFVITGIIPSLIKRFIELKTMIRYKFRL